MKPMKHSALLLCLAAAVAVQAQTAPKTTTTTKAHTVATATHSHAASAGVKLPPGVPPVHVPVKTEFSLRYQDIKIGSGPEAEPNKLYKVFYTGWLASDGRKFDSTDDHPRPPKTGPDGKPVLGPDGKPEQGPPEPIVFPQGFGRVIPGWDQGFNGMHIGGKRRLFIPWQLAYGAAGRKGPDAAHPGIPAKADLIFDVELVDVMDVPQRPPARMPMPQNHPATPGTPGKPGAPAAPGASANPAGPAHPSAPVAPPDPTKPTQVPPQR
jgi:peptidylprolyl isomerase